MLCICSALLLIATRVIRRFVRLVPCCVCHPGIIGAFIPTFLVFVVFPCCIYVYWINLPSTKLRQERTDVEFNSVVDAVDATSSTA